MTHFDDLVDSIKSKIDCSKITPTGFHSIKCPICMDYKVRAGFKFEDGEIIYNCFRGKCPIGKAKWVMGERFSRKFKQVLDAIDVDIPVELLVQKHSSIEIELLDEDLYTKPSYKPMKIPTEFIRYNPTKHIEYKRYLDSRHCFDDDYYIGVGRSWAGLLVIPFYLNGILIGWQGRDIHKKRFNTSSSELIYAPMGYIPQNPVIVEGVFDAKVTPNGIAILHDNISKTQAYLLKNKNPILLPDKNVSEFMKIAKLYGWKMSIPTWKVKDSNAATMKYGRLVMSQMIYDGICDDALMAEVKYNMWTGT